MRGEKLVLASALCAVFFGAAYVAAASETLTGGQAAEKALEHAPGGRIAFSQLKHWTRSPRYEYIIVDDAYRYDVEIDAQTGEYLKFRKHPILTVGAPARRRDGATGIEPLIAPREAARIGRERSGGGEVVKIDARFGRGGHARYEVDVVTIDARHRIEIDGDSGAVLKYSRRRLR